MRLKLHPPPPLPHTHLNSLICLKLQTPQFTNMSQASHTPLSPHNSLICLKLHTPLSPHNSLICLKLHTHLNSLICLKLHTHPSPPIIHSFVSNFTHPSPPIIHSFVSSFTHTHHNSLICLKRYKPWLHTPQLGNFF